MVKSYELLKNVLWEIECGIRESINLDDLTCKFSVSSVHLRRLFRCAFKQTITGYIRSRRLSASLKKLLVKEFSVLDVALEHGFEHEQSYIRAFKKEFGITPGFFRRSGCFIRP
ncbi:MAG: helix-turn-helix domain-containing protein [Treponema sp.]|jgi:AraC family transcriptional regulator|nr:helix-turn-helix domain-containing protein [Treponema sp.]